MSGQNYNQPEHQNQVHCDECGEEINGTVFGATMGRYLCGMCADEYRERQWEQHTTSDEWDRQAISDEPPADQRYYEYPTCEYCGTQHSCWIPCPDTGGKQTVMAMQTQRRESLRLP